MKTDDGGFGICVVYLLIGVLVGYAIAFGLVTNTWKNDVIKHHAAHYDATNGDFAWNQ